MQVNLASGGNADRYTAAKNQAAGNPENTIFDVKRLIGRKFEEKEVQQECAALHPLFLSPSHIVLTIQQY